MLSPTERAEKIIGQVSRCVRANMPFGDVSKMIAAEIEQAQLEILDQNEVVVKIRIEQAYAEGFDACQKEAAKILRRDIAGARSNGYGWVADRLEYMIKKIQELQI